MTDSLCPLSCQKPVCTAQPSLPYIHTTEVIHVCIDYCRLLPLQSVTIIMCLYSMFRARGCSDPVCVCVCGLEAMESSNAELTGGRRDLGRGAKETCVHMHPHARAHTYTHHVLWSRGASALVRVTGSERSVGLKSITTATASHNPIPSHPIHELCAT